MTLKDCKRVIKAMTEHTTELRRIITRLEIENDELKQKLKQKKVQDAK